jgi:hypothetical protein
MIAIHTKCLSATNSRGTRIKAYTASGFEATIHYPYKESGAFAHFEAVKALVKKHNLDWDLNNMGFGLSADGKGYSFTFNCSKI